MSSKQVIVILSVMILMGVLLSLNIKKAGKPAAGSDKPGRMPIQSSIKTITSINLDSLENKDLSLLTSEQSNQIKNLELKAKKEPKFQNLEKIAQAWEKSSKSIWAGHYYYQAAKLEGNLTNWLKAGNSLNEALSSTQDTTSQQLLYQEANRSFNEALKIDSNSLDAKTGLGVSIVAGGGNPMEGIGLLLQVVSKEPKNVKANFSLGLFSMKSGQYQKAIGRFQTVIAQQPGGEAYFYLAQAYQNLKKKKEAVNAYLESKKYIDDPQTLSSIDHFIKELTN